MERTSIYKDSLGGTIQCTKSALPDFDIDGFTVHDCAIILNGFKKHDGLAIQSNGSKDIQLIEAARQFMQKSSCNFIAKPLAFSEDGKIFVLPKGVEALTTKKLLCFDGFSTGKDFSDEFKIVLRDVVKGLAQIQSSGFDIKDLSIENIFLYESRTAAKLAPYYLKKDASQSTSLGATLQSIIYKFHLGSISQELEELLNVLPSQVSKEEIFRNPALWTTEERFQFFCELNDKNIMVSEDPLEDWIMYFAGMHDEGYNNNVGGFLKFLRDKFEHVDDADKKTNDLMGASYMRRKFDEKIRANNYPLLYVDIQTCLTTKAQIFWAP